jgi:outer membrane protein assembly factor BamB
MATLVVTVLMIGQSLFDRPPPARPGPGEIVTVLAVPERSQLILVWEDGTISCVESGSGKELWSTWLPPAASRGSRIAVTRGRVPALLSIYEDEEDHLFMLVFDAAGKQQPRKVRVGTLGAGMYRIVAAEEGYICIHDNGNDLLYSCSLDGTVRCIMDVETCLIGAVLVPQSAPLVVSFHSDRSVIAAQLCGERRWTKRSELLRPVGRVESTIIAAAHNERLVLCLRAEDGAEVWRYAHPEADLLVTMLPAGTLVFTDKSAVKLVRRGPDSGAERLTKIDYAGDVDVVAVGDGQYVACMSGLSLQEGNVLRRRSTKITIFDVSSGKEVHAWTPVKPAVPTSRGAGDWPNLYREK